MSQTRREFLGAVGVLAATTGLSSTRAHAATVTADAPPPTGRSNRPAGKRLLVLGGTGFIGPHIVEEAQRRGMQVTLFNRGKTNPQLFPEVEKLHGDRNVDLSALKGRRWDAVVDTSGYFPRQVRLALEATKGAIGQYVFISSVSVYKDLSKPLDETAPVATLADPTIEKVTEDSYGGLKALCEQAVRDALPGRATLIRPGYIVGPRDSSDRFTYWPVRVSRGGEVLAPGTAADPIQVIDGRDLAAWIVAMVEGGHAGTYNATGPKTRLSMGELLTMCQQLTKSDARYTWVSAAKLKEAKVEESMPIWVPPAEIGMAQVSSQRAQDKGLVYRPVLATLTDTLAWWKTLPAERQAKLRAGLSAEKELELLKLFRKA
jgi:2'-hydroxyisoflavone reductase